MKTLWPSVRTMSSMKNDFNHEQNRYASCQYLLVHHARTAGIILVTNNTREFERVPGLVLEDWVN